MPSIPANIDLAHFWKTWYADRQRARTDILWLCNEVLEYKDVCREVHGPIIDSLQQFKGGSDFVKTDGTLHHYQPACSCWDLEGSRENMWLDPRGHLKTSVITVAHSIQWILNYPDIRILVSMATGQQVVKVAGELLNHIRFNQKLRFLFPEYVPPAKNAKDFGSLDGFTVPCRTNKMLKDWTITTASIGKVTASGHFEVVKNSDLVVLERLTTGALEETRAHVKSLYPLLERGGNPPRRGWMDIEGTRYDFMESYGEIIEREEKTASESGKECWETSADGLARTHKGRWFISIRKNRWPDNDKGKILWPQRFSHQDFDEMKNDDLFLYSANQQNEPVPEGSGLIGKTELEALFVPRRVLKGIPMHWHMTVDLAGMEPENKGDDIAFNVHGFDRDGRLNFIEILAGRFDEREVIDFLFEYCRVFPQIQDIKVEREAHWRTLKPFLMREQEKRVRIGQKYLPPIVDIRRDNRTSKKERIFGIRPWLRAGIIRIAAEIKSRHQVTQETLRFSRTSSYPDNCLDTMADAMQNRDGGVIYDVYPGPEREWARPGQGAEHFLGFDPITHMDRWAGDREDYPYCDPRTGI